MLSYGGTLLAAGASAAGQQYSYRASEQTYEGSRSITNAGYDRRFEEWQHQVTLASKELDQLDKQIAAGAIRVTITEQDLQNHDTQTENAYAVYAFMKSKYTNKDLYSWMVSQISSIYYQSYKQAYDLAKRAQKCFQYELAQTDASFINFGYYDSLKKGLLAGEKLHYDLRRMEAAYLEKNQRTYEMTKHISLAQLDPIALLKLKENGECFVSIPEAVFDADFPGHFLRRIKSVSLSIPCVIGPYTGVSCTLTLLSSSTRIDASDNDEDERFEHRYSSTQSVALSHAQSDSGLFELSFRDERYLPFEGRGVISQWRIELPTKFKSFDYDTISDVIIHLNYTARDGGAQLKEYAEDKLTAAMEDMVLGDKSATDPRTGLFQTFSARRDFPSEWHRFLNQPLNNGGQALDLDLSVKRFPYFSREASLQITALHFLLKLADDAEYSDDDDKLLHHEIYEVKGSQRDEILPDDTLNFLAPNSPDNLGMPLPYSGALFLGESRDPGHFQLTVSEGEPGDFLRGDTGLLVSDAIEDLIIICAYKLR